MNLPVEPALHTTLVSYQRQELTARALESFVNTVTLPYTLLVVDNGSKRSVEDWLFTIVPKIPNARLLLLGKNMYPGFATNRGWEHAPAEATLLQRCDNDFEFLPGWCDEVAERFTDLKLGQLGLRTDEEELFAEHNVGGNCVIHRHLWDIGFRWDERPWSELGGTTEDFYASKRVEELGFRWGRVRRPCIVSLASGDLNDIYYRRSYGVRGIFGMRWDEEEATA